MKKLLTLALTGVLAAAALAVESDPSNTVGFISRSAAPNTYVAFSACPMGLGVAVPALNVIGGQGITGDKILKFTNAWSTYGWTADNTWGGLTLDYNGTYLYRKATVAGTLVVAGDVIPEGTAVTMATFSAGAGYKPFGNPLPMDIDLDTDDLTLDADGFNAGDKILDWTGAWTTYTYNGTTYGVDLLAGKSYIFRIATGGWSWTYTIPGGALAAEHDDVQPVKVQKAVELR